MGKLIEMYEYLDAEPKDLRDTVKQFAHFTPDHDSKKIRRQYRAQRKKELKQQEEIWK